MWPAQRDPHRRDAAYAHERPVSSFLHQFKECLLRDYSYTTRGLDVDLPLPPVPSDATALNFDSPVTHGGHGERDLTEMRSAGSFYPLSLLKDLTTLPDRQATTELVQIAAGTFQNHAFFQSLVTVESKAPYLTYALACLGAVAHHNTHLGDTPRRANTHQKSADDYFWAGTNFLTLALEIDNREARNIDILIAGALLETYGVLTNDSKIWKAVNQFHGYIETVAQRLRLREALPSQRNDHHDILLPSGTRYNAVLSHLVLTDCMRAIHMNRTPSFSTRELHMHLPGKRSFQDAYCSLKHGRYMEADVSNENALLLLCAILSDTIVSIQVFGNAMRHVSPFHSTWPDQPDHCVTPFSTGREAMKTSSLLALWLDNWLDTFDSQVLCDTKALYFFCRLLLVCPQVLQLPQTVCYGGPPGHYEHQIPRPAKMPSMDISDDAMRFSWLLLEQLDYKTRRGLSSVWLPIIVFYAALVVGAKIRSTPPEAAGQSGILRSLTLFQAELNNMGWPCCERMVSTLGTIMNS